MVENAASLRGWAMWALPFMALSVWLEKGEAIWLNLPGSGTKCVSEEIHNNVVVLADYVVISDDHVHPTPTISVKKKKRKSLERLGLGIGVIDYEMNDSEPILSFPLHALTVTQNGRRLFTIAVIETQEPLVTSPYGNTLHANENVTHGQFAFTTTEAGNYLACFWVDGHNPGGGGLSVNLDWKTGIAAKDWESVARKEKIEGIELELRKLEGAVEAIHENLLYLKTREAEMRTVSETTNSRVAWFSIMSLGVCIGVSFLQILHLKQFFQKKKLI
nr:transmembrane emp24 domain-containing protein p24delta3-like [Ipomoea batatas]GME16161.1 transmembrane emp24 domain-containing protein p24delta3-like [Ipomoea batatas]